MPKKVIVRDPIIALSISLATKPVEENRTDGMVYKIISTLMQAPDGKHIIVDEGTCMDLNAVDSDGEESRLNGSPTTTCERSQANKLPRSWQTVNGQRRVASAPADDQSRI